MNDEPKTGHDINLEDEEIEIIEVIGVDDDAPPPSESDADEDEIEVEFEAAIDAVEGESDRGAAVAGDGDSELRDRLLRLQAEFENFKKRIEREKDDHHRHATAVLVSRLLPVLDNFERALTIVPGAEGGDAFREGVALIRRQLVEELRKEGLRPIEAEGQPFDPHLHEAVATDASTDLAANTVIEELQRGYFFQDRLLRPAAVRVSVDASSQGGTEASADAREES